METRYKAIANPSADVWNIQTALDSDDSFLAELAIQHPNVNEEILEKSIKSRYWRVRQYSINHIKCTEKIAIDALNSDDWNMKWLAINRFGMSSIGVIKKALTLNSAIFKRESMYYLYNYHEVEWIKMRATKNHIYHCLRRLMGLCVSW